MSKSSSSGMIASIPVSMLFIYCALYSMKLSRCAVIISLKALMMVPYTPVVGAK